MIVRKIFRRFSLWHNVTKISWSQSMVLRKRTWLLSREFILLYETTLNSPSPMSLTHGRTPKRIHLWLLKGFNEELQSRTLKVWWKSTKNVLKTCWCDRCSYRHWNGNPKTLLARTIPDAEEVDLILVGATGLNAFERLLVGSSSEYILRHAKVDLLVVREQEKTL